jgi:hypothetical protein
MASLTLRSEGVLAVEAVFAGGSTGDSAVGTRSVGHIAE